MPQTIFKSVVVYFQFRDGKEGDVCKSETCPFPNNFINKRHLALKARVEIKKSGRGYGFRWIHRHWCCLTGLQIGGVRAYLRGGVSNAEYDWNLLMGLSNLPVDIQDIVKRAVVEGEVQAEHKVNNLMGEPALTVVHKRRADAVPGAAANQHEDNREDFDAKNEHKPKNAAGAARKEKALAGLPLSPDKDRFGRQLRGGRGGRGSNRGRGGAKFLRGKAAAFAGLPVCHVCQSNSHGHKDCPRTRTNKSVADLEAFASGLLPQHSTRDLRNCREAEPSDTKEVDPEYRASVLVPAQPMSLFNPAQRLPHAGRDQE